MRGIIPWSYLDWNLKLPRGPPSLSHHSSLWIFILRLCAAIPRSVLNSGLCLHVTGDSKSKNLSRHIVKQCKDITKIHVQEVEIWCMTQILLKQSNSFKKKSRARWPYFPQFLSQSQNKTSSPDLSHYLTVRMLIWSGAFMGKHELSILNSFISLFLIYWSWPRRQGGSLTN